MMRLVATLLACAACTSEMPPEARPATRDELSQAEDVVVRWSERIAPVTARCSEYMGRLRVIDADGWTIGSWCGACPPADDPWQDCDAGRYGRRWSCPAQRDGSPIAIIWDGSDVPTALLAVHHESTHMIGHCEAPAGLRWTQHTDPVLWGPDGVHPL